MAPPHNHKRVKNTQIFRPFVYGTTSKAFNPQTNPKPPGTPEDHTHSWTVFLKGVDDTDVTYWCKKVQFKLHESIPNNVRTIENLVPGSPYEVHETGWGEFEITIKVYYVPEANEKPQTLYHHLRLHPYGDTEAEKEAMRQRPTIESWVYEEQIFNEPHELFYDLLTNPAERSGKGGKGGANTKMMKGGMVSSVGDRTALIPMGSRPDQPFSRETERSEAKRLKEAQAKVEEMIKVSQAELKEKENKLADLRKI